MPGRTPPHRMYRAGPASVLFRAKPQKSHAALQTFVTDTSQTAGSIRSRILTIALCPTPVVFLPSFPRKRESRLVSNTFCPRALAVGSVAGVARGPALRFAAAGMTIFTRRGILRRPASSRPDRE